MKIKTAKSVISKYINEKRSNVELSKLHNVLFHILKDVRDCCNRHGLKYMICGGTLLGAVRHKGFIPWDDDVDVMMPRKDCNLLPQAMKEDYGDKYEVTSPQTHIIANVMLNGTVLSDSFETHGDGGKVNIDVFPIDNMPKRKRKFKAFKLYFYRRAEGLIKEYKNVSPIITELCSKHKEVRSYYKKRRALGKFLRFFGTPEKYCKKSIKMCLYEKETGYLGIPCAISYNREKFRAEILTETAEAEFRGELFCIPKYYDDYLKNLYGEDYMTLPPPDKREVHTMSKIDLGIYSELNEQGEFDNP